VQPPNGLLEVKYILSLFGNRLWLVLSVLVLSLLALVFMQARKKLSKQWLVVAFWFFVPFVAMYSFSFIMPMFIERYLMFVFIAFTILVGVITTLSSSLKTYALLLSATVVVLFAATSRANVDNGRHAKEAIAKAVELKEDGRLLIFPKFRTINNTYYLNRSMFINTADYPTSYQMVEAYKQDNIYIINQLSEARLDSTVNKVVLLMTDAGPFDQFKQGLSLDYEIESEEFFPAVYHLLVLKRKL
jgi:hypothetical protein